MKETAKRAAIATLVVGGIVVAGARGLGAAKLLAALLFFAFILAAAMRPTVEKLATAASRAPSAIGLHYVVFVGLVAGFLWAVVPRAIDQIDKALGGIPSTRSELGEQAREATGLKHDLLAGLQRRLDELPTGDQLVDPAVEMTRLVFEVGLGIFFVLASARLLGLRARPGRGPALLAPAPPETEARARHLGADRREARRVRPRSGSADRARGSGSPHGFRGPRAEVPRQLHFLCRWT